jgi:hypothetical protein
VPLGEFFVQDHIEQRLVNLDAFVVFDKAEFAKSIYEEAHAGTRCASTYPQRANMHIHPNLVEVGSDEDEQHRAPHSHAQIHSVGSISVRGRVLRINPFLPPFLPFAGAGELAQTFNFGRLDAPPCKGVSLCPHKSTKKNRKLPDFSFPTVS